jgi:hypothetical protein
MTNDSTCFVYRPITLLGYLRWHNRSQGFIDMLAINGFALPNRSQLALPRTTVNVASKIELDF